MHLFTADLLPAPQIRGTSASGAARRCLHLPLELAGRRAVLHPLEVEEPAEEAAQVSEVSDPSGGPAEAKPQGGGGHEADEEPRLDREDPPNVDPVPGPEIGEPEHDPEHSA